MIMKIFFFQFMASSAGMAKNIKGRNDEEKMENGDQNGELTNKIET